MKLATRVFANLAAASLVATTAWAGTYMADSAHSEISFKVSHLGIANVTGYFNDFDASFDLDPEDLSTLRARATIRTASVDTRVEDRDTHLKSADFLDAETYPEIRFVSTKAEVVGENEVELHGNLTIRGVTKPVVLDTEFRGTLIGPMGKERAAFVASTTVNRKDFGVSWNKTLDSGGFVVGEDVRIHIEIEAVSTSPTD